jgi:hypothetical protein
MQSSDLEPQAIPLVACGSGVPARYETETDGFAPREVKAHFESNCGVGSSFDLRHSCPLAETSV